VTGMTHSEVGARRLRAAGVDVAIADALNGDAVAGVLRDSLAEVVIDELTAIPRTPSELPAQAHVDQKLRIEGGNNLHRAALACGVRRYIQQSSGFFLDAKEQLADENSPLALNASPGIAKYAQMYAYLEQRALESSIEGVALRYGFFYGPNTWYNPDEGAADEIRKQLFPVIEGGKANWSFVHIEDAARATVAALTAEPGKYVVVDDDTSPVSVWLPRFAGLWVLLLHRSLQRIRCCRLRVRMPSTTRRNCAEPQMRRQSVNFTSHSVNASGSASDPEKLFSLRRQAML
jgi:nucleoside-diphosphate-sugar epimerase